MSRVTSVSRAETKRPWESIAKWLPLGVFLIYAALPTENYYWDGVSFAQNIEQAGPFGSHSFWINVIHPNHLLYNLVGYFVWMGLKIAGLQVRAIAALQAINMVLATLCVALLQRTLLRITQSVYLSTTLATLFALSAIFWKFSTDADAYIPALLLLIACFYVLTIRPKPMPLLVGLLHACAMLIHQLAIFFFPAAALGIYLRTGRRGLLQYCGLTAGITLPANFAAFWLQEQSTRPPAFLRWLTYHSADSAFTFNIFKNFSLTLINYPRLFFGGTAHLVQFFDLFMLIAVIALGAVLIALLTQTIRYCNEFALLCLRFDPPLPFVVSVSWLTTYAVFLFFWLPYNTFYKLFCLPAIVVIVAYVLRGYEGPRRYRLALLVAAMALANLAFYIYPYSRPDYNQAVRFAHRMTQVWPDHTVVYYGDFIVDDWYIRYFNPQTTWKQMNPAAGETTFAEDVDRDLASGNAVWLDPTAAEAAAKIWPEATAHFDLAQEDNFPKHPIRFYRWR